MISSEEIEKIKENAKSILESFSKKLKKVNFSDIANEEFNLTGYREDSSKTSHDKEFRKLFFNNAPNRKGDFILAEKKEFH